VQHHIASDDFYTTFNFWKIMYSYSSNIITEKVKVETLCLGKHIGLLKSLMTNGNKHMFLAMFLGNAWRHDFSTHARALSLSNKQPPLCLSLPPKSMPSSSSSVPSEVHFFPALGLGPVAPCYSPCPPPGPW
jgi:hypothetical protein